jgi:hypothetical protein
LRSLPPDDLPIAFVPRQTLPKSVGVADVSQAKWVVPIRRIQPAFVEWQANDSVGIDVCIGELRAVSAEALKERLQSASVVGVSRNSADPACTPGAV